MKRTNKRHDQPPMDEHSMNIMPGDEYRPEVNRGTACMLIGIAAASAGNTALYFEWYPLSFLLFLVVVVCAAWLVRERRRKDRSDYDRYRRTRGALNLHDNEIENIKTELTLKADKPARSNIRPGSRQSDQYKILVGGSKERR